MKDTSSTSRGRSDRLEVAYVAREGMLSKYAENKRSEGTVLQVPLLSSGRPLTVVNTS